MARMFEGVPEHWFAYIAVDDVDARDEKADGRRRQDHDASPSMSPNVGRIVIVQDNNGVMLGLMTPTAQQ